MRAFACRGLFGPRGGGFPDTALRMGVLNGGSAGCWLLSVICVQYQAGLVVLHKLRFRGWQVTGAGVPGA